MKYRIGSVPYLNVKPLVEWFHSAENDADVEMIYATPSHLVQMMRAGEIDVANFSIFEALRNPDIRIVPGISISATGPVKSVRLFCKRPPEMLATVALDTSSLTSAALTRILLDRQFNRRPRFVDHPPRLQEMLRKYDAGLLIGDLRLFDLLPGTTVYDLGQGWYDLTQKPFVYAAWQMPAAGATDELVGLLNRARDWGLQRLETISVDWAGKMQLPVNRCSDYLINVMDFELRPDQLDGLRLFQEMCVEQKLVPSLLPLRFV